jgi:glutamine synthetase
MRELTYFLAPNVNSYKRYQAGSFAPTAMVWGHDNRTCGFRVVGHGNGTRVECRMAGGDANPYLAFAALIAAGLAGIDGGYELEPEWQGSGYQAHDRPHVPRSLREATELLDGSHLARHAFGEDVVDHYLNAARIEQEQFDAAVTDWELQRGFERL